MALHPPHLAKSEELKVTTNIHCNSPIPLIIGSMRRIEICHKKVYWPSFPSSESYMRDFIATKRGLYQGNFTTKNREFANGICIGLPQNKDFSNQTLPQKTRTLPTIFTPGWQYKTGTLPRELCHTQNRESSYGICIALPQNRDFAKGTLSPKKGTLHTIFASVWHKIETLPRELCHTR